jgi:hypothetical protein
MELMFGSFLFRALVLCGALYLVAKDEADFEFRKVALVTAGITIGTTLIDILLDPYVGLFTFLFDAAFMTWMVCKFCWAPVKKAALVTVLFFAVNIGFKVGLGFALIAMGVSATNSAADAPIDQESAEADDMYQQLVGQYENVGTMPASIASAKTPAEMQKAIVAEMERAKNETAQLVAQQRPRAAVTPVAPTATPVAIAAPAPIPVPEPVAPTAAPPVVAAAAAEAPPVQRDPFVPPKPLGPKPKVTAVMSGPGGKSVAMVGNEMVEEGGVVQTVPGDLLSRWRLARFKNGQPVWEPAK